MAKCFSSAPVLDVLDDEYQTWKFNGTFRDYSPYKGPPNAEVDKAWADLFSCTFYASGVVIRILVHSA